MECYVSLYGVETWTLEAQITKKLSNERCGSIDSLLIRGRVEEKERRQGKKCFMLQEAKTHLETWSPTFSEKAALKKRPCDAKRKCLNFFPTCLLIT